MIGRVLFMKLKKIISCMLSAAMMMSCIVISNTVNAEAEVLPYLDTSLSFEERAADLVSRMTLEEKVAQLGYKAPKIERLGVQEYNYWKECLHGVARQGKATNFPAPLSLSNTWNRELIYKTADATSTEARAKNNRYDLSYYTPTINMTRNPRWGRNEETYGEDPYLAGELGAEFVKGMQGDDEKYTKIMAAIKHFAANNNEKIVEAVRQLSVNIISEIITLKHFKILQKRLCRHRLCHHTMLQQFTETVKFYTIFAHHRQIRTCLRIC